MSLSLGLGFTHSMKIPKKFSVYFSSCSNNKIVKILVDVDLTIKYFFMSFN